jgi:aromatic ring-cleaving dioxygenase
MNKKSLDNMKIYAIYLFMSDENSFLLDWYLARGGCDRLIHGVTSNEIDDSEMLDRINELGYDFETIEEAYEKLRNM